MEEDRGVNLAFNRRRRGGKGMNSRRVAACLGVYTPRRDFRNEKANERGRFAAIRGAARRTGFVARALRIRGAEGRVHVAVHGEI